MEKSRKVEMRNIDAELEYEIEQAHKEHKENLANGNGGGLSTT